MVAVTQDLIVVSLADTTTGWAGTSGQLDIEVYKQAATIGTDGSYTYQTGKNGIESCTFTPATNINMTANYTTPHLYWTMRCDVFPFCEDLNTGATNSGHMLRVTDGSGNYTQWHISGADVWDGSWRTFVLDLTNTANTHSTSGTLSLADVDIITFITDNSNSGNIRIIDNTWLDAVRYGDGLQAESTTTEEFNFQDIADDDALTANYYGVNQEFYGVLAAQGGLIIGDATGSATTDFVSLNEQVVFQDQIVSSGHYAVTFVASATATTDVDIVGLVASSPSSTGPDWDFSDSDINSVVASGCTFIDQGDFALGAIGDCTLNKYVGCLQITTTGSDLTGSSVVAYEGAANTSSLVWNIATDPDGYLDDMSFDSTNSTNAVHAIEFGLSSPTSITLRGIDFKGFSATQDVNDSTFHIKRTSGTVTINIVGGSSDVSLATSYRTDGATVVIVQNPVTTTVQCSTKTGVAVSGVLVMVEAADGTGPLPYQDAVTITQAAGLATVAHTAHGLSTNQYIVIRGATQQGYNKVAQITVTGVDAYTYSVDSGTVSPATGSPVATGVLIYGTSSGAGTVSDTRTLASDQLVTGRARKSSAADNPKYKTGSVNGTADSAANTILAAVMIIDQ